MLSFLQNKMVQVRVLNCGEKECDDTVPRGVGVLFQNGKDGQLSDPVYFEDVTDVQALARKVLEQLPEPQDLTVDDFQVPIRPTAIKCSNELVLDH